MKIYKILMLVLVLSVIIQTSYAAEKDYICVDKTATKSPPPIPKFVNIDKNIEETEKCPNGKVPKSILKNTDISSIPPISPIKANISRGCYNDRCIDYASSSQWVWNSGAAAYLTQHSPQIDMTYGLGSGAGINVINSAGGNWVEIGWRKSKYSSPYVILYAKYKVGGVEQAMWGWKQVSRRYYPYMRISTTSSSKGRPYWIMYYNGDWWLGWNSEWLGYYPGSLWKNRFSNGNIVNYIGFVESEYKLITTTDMGNGKWAKFTDAAKIYGQIYLSDYGYWKTASTIKYKPSGYYSIVSTGSNSMRYGGPGKY